MSPTPVAAISPTTPEPASSISQSIPSPPISHSLKAKPEQAGQAFRLLRTRSKSIAYGAPYNQPGPAPYIDGDSDAGLGSYFALPFKARSWEPTLEKAIKAIISIKANHVRSFDTETTGRFLSLSLSLSL